MKKIKVISRQGFTLIEILVALVGVVTLAIAATSFLFSILTQRDQAVVETLAVEQIEVVAAVVGSAVRSARTISVENGGKQLDLTTESECWRFWWDESNEELKLNYSSGESCYLGSGSDERLMADQAEVTAVAFSLIDSDDSSRTVGLTMALSVYRPLASTTQTTTQVFVNLVDEAGGDDD